MTKYEQIIEKLYEFETRDEAFMFLEEKTSSAADVNAIAKELSVKLRGKRPERLELIVDVTTGRAITSRVIRRS